MANVFQSCCYNLVSKPYQGSFLTILLKGNLETVKTPNTFLSRWRFELLIISKKLKFLSAESLTLMGVFFLLFAFKSAMISFILMAFKSTLFPLHHSASRTNYLSVQKGLISILSSLYQFFRLRL